jgi:hypothetical protein
MALPDSLFAILQAYSQVDRIRLVTLYGQTYEGKIRHLYKDCMLFTVLKLRATQEFVIPFAAIESIEVREDIVIT